MEEINMADIKKIIFVEVPKDGVKGLIDLAHQWFKFNEANIKIISGIYGVKTAEGTKSDQRRTIIIRYTGDAGPNPQDCKHEHTKKEVEDATCQHPGVERITCLDCGMYLGTKDIPITDHSYTWTSNNDATCTKDGTKTGTCKHCNKKITLTDIGTALGHDYVFTSDNNATCTDDGTETGTCNRCHESVTREDDGSALGHDYIFTNDNNATCTENGTETGVCSHDKNHTVTREIPNSALGHDLPDKWTTRLEPTEESDGLEFKKCSRCDYEVTQPIPKLRHSWFSNNDGTHTCVTPGGCGVTEDCSPNEYGDVCEKCGYKTPEDIKDFIITTDYINGMTVGQEFSQTITTNAQGEVDWDLAEGIIPPGMVFYRTGILSGTPQNAGVYTFTIKAIHGDKIATKTFTVNVASVNYTITFDPQGGVVSETTRVVSQGSTIGELPVPTRDEYDFGGWFTAIDGGLKIDASYSVSSDVILYARWGQGTDIEFGDATSQFNMQYEGDRTNYQNQPYTIYHRFAGGNQIGQTDSLVTQVGISSTDMTNNMTDDNKKIQLYIKVTNNGNAGNFDIGFDCDSYVNGNDRVLLTRLANGVRLGNVFYDVTVPYDHTCWIGNYNQRVANRYENSDEGYKVGSGSSGSIGSTDTGYALTMNNVFINAKSYVILEVTFQKA